MDKSRSASPVSVTAVDSEDKRPPNSMLLVGLSDIKLKTASLTEKVVENVPVRSAGLLAGIANVQ